ncbi:MAG: GTPase [Candidatus Aenigmarchaeota archaeon]|nr:GTPase [Candidatus Aenigmarchaeota archaeon]
MKRKKVIIMGAAGRDFHNFNAYFRGNPRYNIVAFTATQIPNIAGRKYPKELSGRFYPKGIPIYPEEQLPKLIKDLHVEEVVFAYSDVSHEYVMNRCSIVNAAGADFKLMGTDYTMLHSEKPVISVCAVRTGCGKSQTSRKIVDILKKKGIKVVAIRHPMPYGNLADQAVQRFEKYEDLVENKCTIEEMEEYEPYIERGLVVYSGVDYPRILDKAEKEADVIVWDGGNNDTPFIKPDMHIVVTDPHRAGNEKTYYPGETNFRMADAIIINKMDTADLKNVKIILDHAQEMNPKAIIIKANSKITVDDPASVKGKRVLVVEDGPTLTHGGMTFGAGVVAAQRLGCELVNPKRSAVGSIKKILEKYPHLQNLLPAMGYGKKQMKELEDTINKIGCDAVVVGTPINLERLLKVNKPLVRVRYDLEEIGKPNLTTILNAFIRKHM